MIQPEVKFKTEFPTENVESFIEKEKSKTNFLLHTADPFREFCNNGYKFSNGFGVEHPI